MKICLLKRNAWKLGLCTLLVGRVVAAQQVGAEVTPVRIPVEIDRAAIEIDAVAHRQSIEASISGMLARTRSKARGREMLLASRAARNRG